MSFRLTMLKRCPLIGLFLGLTGISLFAQVANAPVKFADSGAITPTFVEPPSMGENSGGGSNDDKQWLKVEFRFSVTKDAGAFLDAVQFKIWIEGRDMLDPLGKPNEGIFVALTGSVTYVNIAQNNDVYGVFYVPPSTIKRYSKLSSSDFERLFNIHIEADVDGKYVDGIDENKEKDLKWYQSLKTVPGLVYRQNQCAFIVTDPTRYPAIQLPTESTN